MSLENDKTVIHINKNNFYRHSRREDNAQHDRRPSLSAKGDHEAVED
jgi:hypothetical protein